MIVRVTVVCTTHQQRVLIGRHVLSVLIEHDGTSIPFDTDHVVALVHTTEVLKQDLLRVTDTKGSA